MNYKYVASSIAALLIILALVRMRTPGGIAILKPIWFQILTAQPRRRSTMQTS
jgi:hypothetical protein